MKIHTTPRFAISWQEKDGHAYAGFEFDQFRDFLLKNNIAAIAVTMFLICKDGAEMTHSQGEVARFAIRTNLDKSLADGGKNPQHFDFIAVPFIESLSENSWILDKDYSHIYSGWNVRN